MDRSEAILIFCTSSYLEKKNALKELYRAVCQRRPIIALLEPDATQEGGFDQAFVEARITDELLDRFRLRRKWQEWKDDGELLPSAFLSRAPDANDVRAALFSTPPIEWNRLPHFQDVTIRLIAQNGILHVSAGTLYLQGEVATQTVALPPTTAGYEFHLFCSDFNAGAKEIAEELQASGVIQAGELTYTSEPAKLQMRKCKCMLVLLDSRTWTSGSESVRRLVEQIEAAMRTGMAICCAHEFPSVVGPHRHACDFDCMFGPGWTPHHLKDGETNLYREIAIPLKGREWRKPGLVGLAKKLATLVGHAGESQAPAVRRELEKALSSLSSLSSFSDQMEEDEVEARV